MRSGRLEQIATPDDLYHRPATAFVAEFVGTMNRLPGVLLDSSTVEVLGVRRPVASAGTAGPEVTVLVRPEAVTVTPDPNGPALVVVRTFHGAMTRLSVRLPTGDEVLADLPSPTAPGLTPGSTATVSLVDSPVLLA
jgi:putative spermidine/putrescine transport system ATP-binding protein